MGCFLLKLMPTFARWAKMSLTGAYFPLTFELDFNHSGLARNRLVRNFMATWQSDTTLPF